MATQPALVFLPGARDSLALWEPLPGRLRDRYDVVCPILPGLSPDDAGPFSLERAAVAVSAATERSTSRPATICGVGLGALVALQLAVIRPQHVSRLALVTRQVALSPLVLSLPAAVLRLLPAATVQRLGAGRDQVLALLDQVRPVDAAALASRAPAPALVLCGARDRINHRASTALARALPSGELRLIPRAGSGWLSADTLADELLTLAEER